MILDTSAVLVLLRDESGARKSALLSEQILHEHREPRRAVSYYANAGADRAAIEGMLRALPIELVPADRDLAVAAGLLRSVTAEAACRLATGSA